MRPIDADRLKETIKGLDVESPDIKTARIVSQTIQEIFPQIIDDEPTIETEPVVRCKDCKHRKERHYEESGEKPYIKYECKFTKYSMSDDGFCSFGARMDGDSE